ncbi:MAG: NifU family protein [Promethearchaeota archaeon]
MSWKDNVTLVINQIRPSLQADGGDVEILEILDDGTVKVELQGHCRGCPYSQMTLKNGIEQILKEKIPEVKEVINL